ncbi:MAG: hypothetical protein WA989_12370, partial [Henriciella sp.]|uniref:hypothetical protein n=1 Tax=Henriciella sp. TaxID=1968823 RepID=UPI003C76E6B9
MSSRLLALGAFIILLLAACGPTPHPDERDLSELYEAAPRGPLPDGVRPLAYELDLKIDPRETYFGGTARITVELDQPSTGVWLHGKGLE